MEMRLTVILLFLLFFSCRNRQTSIQGHEILSSDTLKETKIEKDNSIFEAKDSITKEVYYTNLSYNFDYKVNFKRLINIDHSKNDSCFVKIIILNKKTHLKLDSLVIKTDQFYDTTFKDINNVRSYMIGKNKNKIVADNDYGDLIIADLNFDNKEDIAIVRECANSGQLYNFYIQENDCKFKLDNFLTDSMVFFPEINRKNKTLITYIAGGACYVGESRYKMDRNLKWRKISHEIHNICDENK